MYQLEYYILTSDDIQPVGKLLTSAYSLYVLHCSRIRTDNTALKMHYNNRFLLADLQIFTATTFAPLKLSGYGTYKLAYHLTRQAMYVQRNTEDRS
jgi:hypothetical protein